MEWAIIYLALLGLFSLPFSKSEGYRLPETVIPSRYEIDIFVPQGVFKGQNDTFEGSVTITFQVQTSTSEINLHRRLNISQIVLSSASGGILETDPISTYNPTTEIDTITLQSALAVDTEYTLFIRYYGIFETDNMRGFYISTYTDENNELSYLVLTKFEPVHSRHAFPCLDEPQYKATFALSLTYPTGLNALANTPENSTTVIDSIYTKTVFEDTSVVMSTYLLAFAISSFTCSEGYTIENGVNHSVCSRPEESKHREWALEIGTSAMRTLESITGIKYGYSMPKMDQLAIPDFASGAMENWGLVSYRETGLLWSEEDSAVSYKKSIALVITHEFTHMWFGNLVTCKWWDYTFLNEGFARFYQYLAAAATKQLIDWELDKHFIVEVVQVALLTDSSSNALSLTSPSLSPTDIAGKFGTISYSKGASILRMIEKNIMGPDNFIYGIRNYLKTYEKQATVPANLWSSLVNYVPSNNLPTDVSLTTVLNNWVELSGHPVVKVTKSGDDIILTQERFLLSGNSTREYYVPVTYTVSSDPTTFWNTTVKTWLIPNETLTISGALSESDWIILNNRQSGFYRVDYDSTLWSGIKSQLHSNHLKIDVLNRAQIVSDAYNFARSGHQSGYGTWTYSDVLDILRYLKYEQDYYPWYATIVGNNHLLQRIGSDSEVGTQFTTWMLNLMQNVTNTVPFDAIDDSNQVYSMKQALILTRACKYGDASCISNSKEMFANYRDNGVKVPKNLRSTVYCNALRHSDTPETDFNFLWQKYTETSIMTEVLTILSGLGCAEDKELLKWFLGQTINATAGIRLQDFTSVWSYVYSSGKTGTDAAIEYITENYVTLNSSYSSVETLISSISSYVCYDDQIEKLEALSNVTELNSSEQSTVRSAIDSAKSNIEWGKVVAANIKNYFNSEDSGANISKSSMIFMLIILMLSKLVYNFI